MRVLITGAAGFIGFHVAKQLCKTGHDVIGYDNFCHAYYVPDLKYKRWADLEKHHNFKGVIGDINDTDHVGAMIESVDYVVHLAAHASVKYSVKNPIAYMHTNDVGFVSVLEAIRTHGKHIKHCVYASTSAVYAGNTVLPSSESHDVSLPVSLYGASKRSNELMAQVYFHNDNIPLTGLRFFTVYGPWGRPDMAIYLFTQRIIEGTPIQLFNYGHMRRDFIYIDDVVQGILSALNRPPKTDISGHHPLYNLGNCYSENLYDLVHMIEDITGHAALIEEMPLESGDPIDTYADISLAREHLNFKVTTDLKTGLKHFIEWYNINRVIPKLRST